MLSIPALRAMNDVGIAEIFEFWIDYQVTRTGKINIHVPQGTATKFTTFRAFQEQALSSALLLDTQIAHAYEKHLVDRRVPIDPLKFTELYDMDDFIDLVYFGTLEDIDGYGYFSDGEVEDDHCEVFPSIFEADKYQAPEWATHITWYAR